MVAELPTDFATLAVGGEQIDDLDAGHQNLLFDAHINERGRLGVNGRFAEKNMWVGMKLRSERILYIQKSE